MPAAAPVFSCNAATAAIVHLPNGVRIEVTSRTDSGWLPQLIQATCRMERSG
jgi:hypothetical protein